MAHDQIGIDWTDSGFQALLDPLGVSFIGGAVQLPFDLGSRGRAEVAAIGWATVELDRAAAQLSAELGTTFEPAIRDALLGATVRRSTGTEPPILIEEPDTEGRLSGALAKHGEGPIALYLRLAHLDQLPSQLSIRAGNGPLGPARLVLNGPPWGPFLILVGPAGPATGNADRVPSQQ
ncbi:MAG TPA: hypothetical protein VKR24_10765 [Candidatus Limnocylindrales bacterium]|nr:hypothetical protein [Candidatus Limnocylindrales bacterium]